MDHKNMPILVTGGSGYIASWIIRRLLESGHTVHATVRDLSQEEKVGHLKAMGEELPGQLQLFEADLLQAGAFDKAAEGCRIVMHTASPFKIDVKNAERDLIAPALQGTHNVLDSCTRSGTVERVVLTSSVAAIFGDGIEAEKVPGGKFNESHWNESSSPEHQPYPYSKTIAEREAWAIADAQEQWRLVVINPGFVMGPSLSNRTDGTSADFMVSLLRGKFRAGIPDLYFGVVDVREVAAAHIEAAFRADAQGRHIVCAAAHSALEMAQMLQGMPGGPFPLPKRKLPRLLLLAVGPTLGFSWKYLRRNIGFPIAFDNTKSREALGLAYRPVPETLQDHARQILDGQLV
ncbi:SDR family oxidoreductase [Phaeodactylibacter luteus]|uniref:Aldehyde reductase n=1 Tax=Phaeodactylibacter luteus TaxID=1564516 RepID=A0A5C6RMP6_9BACT|nr:aldehyde reductase [Phaeodactylibacter luteus]TXB63199.1 aldehyde reductase [Phaeodactylibacter luteus]